MTWQEQLKQAPPVRLDQVAWPRGLSVAVLGPHPDDFDVAAVTLRHLDRAGARISVAVLSASAIGVLDDYCAPERKAETRRAEQRASCRLFGLPDDALEFPPVAEDEAGEPADTPANRAVVAEFLLRRKPDLVLLPHGSDQKAGHRNVYSLFRGIAAAQRLSLVALLHRDPKTLSIRIDAVTPYDEAAAEWKGRLLRCHDTQHQRNLRTRGHGIDERLLGSDRRNAAGLKLPWPLAEAFEIEHHQEGRKLQP